MKQFIENAAVTAIGAIGIGFVGWLYFLLVGGIISLI